MWRITLIITDEMTTNQTQRNFEQIPAATTGKNEIRLWEVRRY